MSIQSQLTAIGLHKNEAIIYQFLLANGLSSPPQIAKGTGIARTNCYQILQSLKTQGLINEQAIQKRKAYLASDPEQLFQRVSEQKERIEELLPELKNLYQTHQNKPIIRFYDGFDAVKDIYRMTLSSKEVFGIGSTNELVKAQQKFYSHWIKQLKEKDIVFHDILSHPSGDKAAPEMKSILKGLYDYKLTPKSYEDFPTDFLIWDNNIALLSFEQPIFGTVITNPTLANTFKLLFRILWDKLEA